MWLSFQKHALVVRVAFLLIAATGARAKNATAQDAPPAAVIVTTDNAPLQSGRELVTRVRQGARLPVVQTQGEWLRVRVAVGGRNVEGWIHARHVREEPPTAPALSEEEKQKLLAEALSLEDQGDKLWNDGQKTEAVPRYRRMAELRERALGQNHRDTAKALMALGDALVGVLQYADAEKRLTEAVRILQQTAGEDDLDTAEALISLGYAYYRMGRTAETVRCYEQVLRIRRKQLGEDHEKTVWAIHELGSMHWDLAQFDRALPYAQQAFDLRRKTLGEGHHDTIQSLVLLGYVRKSLGNLTESRQRLETALAASRAAKQRDNVALALYALASVAMAGGELQAARPLLEESLAISIELEGEDSVNVAFNQNLMANLLNDLGDFAQARPHFEAALAGFQTAVGADSPQAATCWNDLGICFSLLGDAPQARRCFEQALAIRRRISPDDTFRIAVNLSNYAGALNNLGKYQEAQKLAQEAVKLTNAAIGEDRRETAMAIYQLGYSYEAAGDYAAARARYEQALAVQRRILSGDHEEISVMLGRLACAAYGMGDLAAARMYSRQGLDITRRILGDDHWSVGRMLLVSAHIAAREGDFRGASDSLDTALRVLRRHHVRVLSGLSAAEQLAFLKTQGSFYRLPSFVAARPDDVQLVCRSAEWLANHKAAAHEILAQRTLLARRADDLEAAALVRRLDSVREALARNSLKNVAPAERVAHQARLVELTTEEEALARQLAQRGLDAERGDPWVALEDIRRRLPAGTVLIDIARYGYLDVRRPDAVWDSTPHYAAWIIPAAGAGEVRFIELGLAKPIDEAVRQARSRLSDAPAQIRAAGETQAERETSAALEKLAKLVLHPVLAGVRPSQSLILSPDSQLWLTPWSALPLPDGRYAIEAHEIAYVVSSRDLVAAKDAHDLPRPPVVLADPNFDGAASPAAADDSRSPESLQRGAAGLAGLPPFARLPATAAEARAIAPSLAQFAGADPQVYLSDEAREDVFKSLRRPHVLTLSTHGFFLQDQEVAQHEGLPSAQQTRSAALTVNGKPLENPLLRCGLVLAGCNRRDQAPTSADDGVLTGLEIVGTDLRGTKLVVLSACETGVGEVRNGEGVAGLRQAFQLAGAEAVVASLWSVPDLETARLMKSFFEHLAQGKSKAAALRAAQLERIENRRERFEAAHPFYWAAFTVTGG